MMRGVQIDKRTVDRVLQELWPLYERDARSGELSDDAIAAVNTIIRALTGTLEKTAHAVGQRYVGKQARPYFPIVNDADKFPETLEQHFPKLAANQPKVAAAFRRYQPFQPGQSALGHLKQLYRAHHHHDFIIQQTVPTEFVGLGIAGMGVSIGGMYTGPPSIGWEGVLIEEQETPAGEAAPWLAVLRRRWVDWYWTDPPVSVWHTLTTLQKICQSACEDIAAAADL